MKVYGCGRLTHGTVDEDCLQSLHRFAPAWAVSKLAQLLDILVRRNTVWHDPCEQLERTEISIVHCRPITEDPCKLCRRVGLAPTF